MGGPMGTADVYADDAPKAAPRAERYAVAPDGSRTLEGVGLVIIATGGGEDAELCHASDPPLSIALSKFAFAWREGSRELLVGPPSAPPSYVLVVLDADPPVDMRALVASLGATVLPSGDEEDSDVPEAVRIVASAIGTTASVAATTVTASASLMSTGMESMLQLFKANVQPAEQPVTLGPASKAVVGAAAASAGAAADLTGGMRTGMGTFTQKIGSATASMVTGRGAGGDRLRGTWIGKSAATLGSATLEAASTVFGAVEESTGQVVAATAGTAAGLVGHRYGPDAEEAAAALGGSVQKAHKSVFNVASMGLRGFTRSVAKETAKGVATGAAPILPDHVAADAAAASLVDGGAVGTC